MIRIFSCCLLLLLTAVPLRAAAPGAGSLTERAIERYRQALTVDPGNLPLHYYLGVSLLIEGRSQEAVDQFRTAYPGFSDSAEANYNFALALTQLGDADSALIYLQRAEDLGAADQPALFPITNLYFNLALNYIDSDQPEDAIRLLHRVIVKTDNASEARRLLGDLYLNQGQAEKAAEQWQRLLLEQPGDTIAREALYTLSFNRALKALEEQRLDDAQQAFLKARELEPESALCGYYLGYLAYQRQDYPAGIRLLTHIAASVPEDMQSSLAAMVYNSAAALLEAGDPKAAQPAATFLAESPQTEIQAHYLTGNIHLALNQYPQAREQYLQVLKHNPAHVGANLNLQKADQGTAETYYQQGRSLYRQGDLPAAISKLEAALSINPGHGMARSYLDQSHEDLDREMDRALAASREALQDGHPRLALEEIRRGLYLQPDNLLGRALEQQAIEALESQIQTLLTDAEGLIQTGANHDAEKIYQQVLQLMPQNQQARDGLDNLRQQRTRQLDGLVAKGLQALENGKLSDARQAYRQALDLQPQHAAAAEGLERTEALVSSLVNEELHWARRARQSGQASLARKHYKKALRLRSDPRVEKELGQLQQSTSLKIDSLLKATREAAAAGRLNQARGLLTKAEAIAPENDVISRQRSELEADIALQIRRQLTAGQTRLGGGDFQAALTAYRQVLDLEPGNEQAVAGLKKSRAAVAERLESLVKSATRAIDEGDYANAESNLQKARSLDPYHAATLQELKRLNSIRSAGLAPADVQRLYLQGIELYTGGHYQDAISAWQQVIELKPQHEKARLNIEKARRKLTQIKAFGNG